MNHCNTSTKNISCHITSTFKIFSGQRHHRRVPSADEVNSNDNETHDIVKEYVYGDISKNYSQNFNQSTANSRAIPRTFGLKYPVNCTVL